MKQSIPNLTEIARHALIEKGFLPDFSPEAKKEADHFKHPAIPRAPFRDLRNLLWVSIDNDDSRDLDQLTFAEKNKIYVAIADVDALVTLGSAIDQHAFHNTTSIYCPTQVFPMLPLKLSTDLTSLCENKDRTAIVIEIKMEESGKFDLSEIYPALVRNHAKLTYNGVGAWLEHQTIPHPVPSIPMDIPGLREQLSLQDRMADQIRQYRNTQGALVFAEMELEPVIVNGLPVDIRERAFNRAHRLIENFMIAANVAASRYLNEKGLPSLRRIVRTPKKWDRIVVLAKELGETLPKNPDAKALRAFLIRQEKASPLLFRDLSLAIIKLIGRGEYAAALPQEKGLIHFDLAEIEYTHSTAPNRRYPDLVMQRLLKSSLYQTAPPYSLTQLKQIAQRCTEKENDANKVERRLLKCAAAMVFVKDVGKMFSAMVTGASPKGTWVRVLNAAPIEGKLIRGFQNLDVGDHLKVKLIKVDVINGHIDFAKVI